jgi:hypothetical protein
LKELEDLRLSRKSEIVHMRLIKKREILKRK